MNFLQQIWSRLTGDRRREEEEERQQQARVQAPAPIATPIPKPPTRTLSSAMDIPGLPKPTPMAAPPVAIQRALQPIPIQKPLLEPTPQRVVERPSTVRKAGRDLENFINSGKFNIDIPNLQQKFDFRDPYSVPKGAIDIGLDTVTSLANFAGNTGLDVTKEYAKSVRKAAGGKVDPTNYNELRSGLTRLGTMSQGAVPGGVEAMPGTPVADSSKNWLDDPFYGELLRNAGQPIMELSNLWGGGTILNAAKGGAARQVGKNIVRESPIGIASGAGSGAVYSEGQTPREMTDDIVSSALLGGGIAAGASGALTGLRNVADVIPQFTRNTADRLRNLRLERFLNRAEQPGEVGLLRTAAEQEGNLLRELSDPLQQQLLTQEVSPPVRQVPPVGPDLPLPNPANVADEVPTSVARPTQVPENIARLNQDIQSEVGGVVDTTIDRPSYLRPDTTNEFDTFPEPPMDDSPNLTPEELQAFRDRLEAERLDEDRRFAQYVESEQSPAPQTPNPISTTDLRAQAAIPDAANALPTTPPITPARLPGETAAQLALDETPETGAGQTNEAATKFISIFGDDALAFQRDLEGESFGTYSRRDNQSRVRSDLSPAKTEKVAMHEGMHKAVNTLLNDDELATIRSAVNTALEQNPQIRDSYRKMGYEEGAVFEEVVADAFAKFTQTGKTFNPQGAIDSLAAAIDDKLGNISTTNPGVFNQIMASALRVLRGVFEAMGDRKNVRLLDELFADMQAGSLADRFPENRFLAGEMPLSGNRGESMSVAEYRQRSQQPPGESMAFKKGDTEQPIPKSRLAQESSALGETELTDSPPNFTKGKGKYEGKAGPGRGNTAQKQAKEAAAAAPPKEAPYSRQNINQLIGAKTNQTTRTVAHDPELQARAEKKYDAMADEAIVAEYTSPKDEGSIEAESRAINTAAEIHDALVAGVKLREIDTPESLLALQNIIDGLSKGISQAGQVLSVASRLSDILPPETRSKMMLSKINDIRERAGLAKLNDAEAKTLTDTTTQQFKDLTAVRARLDELNAAAEPEKTVKGSVDYLNKVMDSWREAQAINGEIQRTVDSVYPPKHPLEKAANYQRISMLTSLAGRLNDMAGTTSNVFNTLFREVLKAPIATGLNKAPFFSRKLKADEGTLFNPGLMVGTKAGLKDSWAAFKGDLLSPNTYSPNQAHQAGQAGLIRAPRKGPWNRTKNLVTAAVQAPSNLSRGLSTANQYRMALSAAKAAGLTGDDAKVSALKATANPDKLFVEKADALWEQANNTNSNIAAEKLGGLFNTSGKSGGARGVLALVQNSIQPFVSFMATATYNSVMHHNVVASFLKSSKGLVTGDAQLASDGLAGLVANGGLTYAGMQLAQSGLISETDAEGYRSGGPFLRFGDRYISLGFFGTQVGIQLAIGAAVDKAFRNEGNNENLLTDVMQTATNSIENIFNTTGATGMLGSTNSLASDIYRGATEGEEGGFGDNVLLRQLGRMAGQSIPAITSDINSVINQIPAFNPTKEEALTRVEDAEGKVDYGASEWNKFVNRIPWASQTLPRNPGVAADDFLDRITRGGHLSSTQIDTENQERDMQALADDLKSRGIPNPYDYQGDNTFDEEVQRYRESDNFTIVAEALQHKYDMKAEAGAPQKDLDKIQKDIDVAGVAERNAIEYADLAMYYGAISGVDAANSISNTEFKAMMDPDDEAYNPDLANKLYQIDTWMAEAGVSSNDTDRTKNYYSLGKAGAGRGGGAGSRGGDISAPINLRGLSLAGLTTESLKSTPIPRIKRLATRDLVRPRKITVS